MSFGFYDETSGLQYAGTNLRGLLAKWKNIGNIRYLAMLFELQKFNKRALLDLNSGEIGDEPLDQYLKKVGCSAYLRDNYVVPMGAAIWSSPDQGILEFPAKTFIQFFYHHGLLTLHDRPQWQTVKGGSYTYVNRFLEIFSGEVLTGSPVKRIQRQSDSVNVEFSSGKQLDFDRVVLACHADQVLHLLDAPSDQEQSLFGCWEYQLNRVVLHTDKSVLPPSRAAWASWNYTREELSDGTSPVSVSYHMNRLQGFNSDKEYCVTLNRRQAIRDEAVVRRIDYYHPVFTTEAVSTTSEIRQLSGLERVHYCGSYFGYGFHEDAALSALQVAKELGIDW
jgi:predicted NAD/FAD-binding protein